MVLTGVNPSPQLDPRPTGHAPGRLAPMATQRQIAANRRNALNSIGPKTEEGKIRSRGNAVTHGLTGAGIVVAEEDAQAMDERREAWRAYYGPVTAEEEWLFEQVVLHSVR